MYVCPFSYRTSQTYHLPFKISLLHRLNLKYVKVIKRLGEILLTIQAVEREARTDEILT